MRARHNLTTPLLAPLALFIGLCLALGAVPARATAAPGDGITLSVQPFFGGHYKYGEWLPLRVTVANNGPDLSAELRATVSSEANMTYVVPAPLPSGARKEIELDVMLPSFGRAVRVDLARGDEVLKSVQADVFALRNITYVVGVIAPDVEPYSLIEGADIPTTHRTIKRVAFPLADIPARADLMRSMDALIIGDTDTSALTPAQAEALRQWVATGGRLIVAGGPGAQRTLAGLPPDLVPARVTRTSLRGVSGLVPFSGVQTWGVDGDFVAALPAAPFGYTLAPGPESSPSPLIVERRFGQGWVTYLVFDPALGPFKDWTGMRAVWFRLFTPGSVYPMNQPPDISQAQMLSQRLSYVLTNLPSLELPSVRWLALLLAVYIVMIGPANYLVLRRLRRLEWAWFSIPALTFVFAGGAFGLGYALRGSDVILNQVSVVQKLDADAPALVRSYIGVFSPTRSAYNFRIEGDALLSPIVTEPNRFGGPFEVAQLTVVEGAPALVRNLGINQWAMQGFQAERYAPGQQWDLGAALRFTGERVEGVLRNTTPYDLSDVVVIVGNRFARLGDIRAGGELPVKADLPSSQNTAPPLPYALFQTQINSSGPNGPSRDVMVKQNLLEAYLNNGKDPAGPSLPMGITVLAWFRGSPFDVSLVQGQVSRQQTGLLLVTLPLDLSGPEITLAPGLVTPQAIEFQSDANICGPGGRTYIGAGQATLDYTLPPTILDAAVTRLALYPSAADGNAAPRFPQAALYDWSAGEWVELGALQAGESVIKDPARFVSQGEGLVRLRLHSNDRNSAGCFLFDLGLQARRDRPAAGSQ